MTGRTDDGLSARLAAVGELAPALAAASDLDEVFRTLHRATERFLDVTIFILALYDRPSQTVHVVKQMYGGVERPGGSFPLGEGISSQAITSRRPSLIRHWTKEGPPRRLRYASDEGSLPESALSVPLLVGEEPVGVLLVQSYAEAAYDEDDLATLRAIAGVGAAAIEHLRRSTLDVQTSQRLSQLETVLASMTEALVIVDREGAIVELNPAARQLLGAQGGTIVVGRPLDQQGWDRWPPSAQAVARALAPLVEAVRRGEARRDVEAELRLGGLRVLSFSAAPMVGPDGQPGGGIIAFRDVTGRREVERLKDEVLGIASHDLKGPIASVRGYAQLLKRDVEQGRLDHSRLARRLDAIVGQTDRLSEMLSLLLDFSQAEAGRLAISPAPTELVAVAERLVAAAQVTSERHSVTLRAPPRAEGHWDEARLAQLLQNLLSNAIKYSPEGGQVELSLEPEAEHVLVAVRDERIGLAPDEVGHVFERFYRAGAARHLEGSGLGLYICQTIVAAHGGQIWAESAGPGQGTTFKLTLPWRAAGQ